jgi:hypothetical protein
MPTGYAGLNPDGTRIIAASGNAALDCACCGETPPVCCVLPPEYIDLTSYVYVGYDLPYEDALYSFAGITSIPDVSVLGPESPYYQDCEESPFFTPTVGFDIYKYYTPTTIPFGAYAGQTQRIVLLINCDGNDFCIDGGYWYGPAQMFFADENWNPITHIDNVPKMETSGCVLLMTTGLGIYWDTPTNADFLPEYWREHCPSCTGNSRMMFSPCEGTGGIDIIAEFPSTLGISIGNVYKLTFNNGFEGCYTAISLENSSVPSYAVVSAIPKIDCSDGDCASTPCSGPDYSYRVAYCSDPLTPVGYLTSPTPLAFGYAFKEISTDFPVYIVLDCQPEFGLPPIFLPMGIETTTCP